MNGHYHNNLVICGCCCCRGKNHTTSVIATVSPSPTDLEHTLNTLEHVTMMDPALETLPVCFVISTHIRWLIPTPYVCFVDVGLADSKVCCGGCDDRWLCTTKQSSRYVDLSRADGLVKSYRWWQVFAIGLASQHERSRFTERKCANFSAYRYYAYV
jgi:hypothetical protein